MGNSKVDFSTSHGRTYGVPRDGKQAKLDPRMEKDLRDHHFDLRDKETPNAITKNTMYREQYVWKLNEDSEDED